jgi:hypothetical protein
MRGPLVKNYYRGWCTFVKLCRDFDGTLTIFPAANDVAIHTVDEANHVRYLAPDAPVALTGVRGVAAGSRDSMTFQVGSMPVGIFLDKGTAEGASLAL